MILVLKIVLGAEIILGVMWTVFAAMVHGPGGLGAIAAGLIIFAVFAAFFLFAAWAFWKHPHTRTLAGWIMALPLVFFFAPLAIRAMAGEHLSSDQFIIFLCIAAIAALCACWVAPRKVALVVPDFLIRSKLFNWLVILAVIAGWLLLVFVVIYIANEDISSTARSESGLAMALIFAAAYLLWLGMANFIAATWAWLCLRSATTDNPRKLNIAQLVVAAPGILIGVAIAAWLSIQSQL